METDDQLKTISNIQETSLASEINYKLAIINLNSIYSDDHLSSRMSDVPDRSIILLEDVDAMF